MQSNQQWCGYRHIDGTYHLHQIFNSGDLDAVYESNKVALVYGPWKCNSRAEAAAKMKNMDRRAPNEFFDAIQEWILQKNLSLQELREAP